MAIFGRSHPNPQGWRRASIFVAALASTETGALTLTGFAPTVTVSNNQTVTPGLGQLSLTGFAPTVTASNHQSATPAVGALTLSGFAPSVAVSSHQTATPALGQLVLSGFAPTVSASNHQTASPGVGSLLLTGFAPSVPRIYYVSNAGDDGDDGLTTSTPWLTLAKVDDTAKVAGDTVALRRGDTFAESLSIRGNGAAGTPLTFTAYGSGADPIISSADIVTSWEGSPTTVAGGLRYAKLTLGWAPNYLWREDGTVGSGTVINLNKAANLAACTALNDWFYDSGPGTLYVVVATGEDPDDADITIHAGRRNVCINEFTDGQDYIRLANLHCRFQHEGSFYGQLHIAANSVLNAGWEIDSCLFEWGGSGIKFGGQGTNSFAQTRVLTVTNTVSRYHREHGALLIFLTAGSLIQDCQFYGNGRMGLGIAMTDGVIDGCEFNDNANALTKWTVPSTVQGFDHGLYLVGQEPNFDRSTGTVVQDCIAHGNAKAGYSVDALASDHTFLRCLSYENTLFGFMLEGGTTSSSSGTKVYHCVAWGNQQSGLHVTNCHGPFDARNNLFYFNGRQGNNQDVYIEWNIGQWTLHSGTNGVDAIYKHAHLDWDPVAVGDDAHNVLTEAGSSALAAGQWFYDAGAETLYVRKGNSGAVTNCWCDPPYTLDYNGYTPVVEQLGGHAIYRLTDAGAGNQWYTTLAALQAAQTGIEANGIQADPLYVDAPDDFTLEAGSPAIDAGVAIAGINDSYIGSAPDMGAFETEVSASPGVGALILTGFAPTVSVSNHQAVTPAVGALTLAGFAPAVSVSDHQSVTPSVGALTLAGFAPAIAVSDHQTAAPALGELQLTGFAPTISVTAHQIADTATGQLVLSGSAPAVSVSDHQTASPALGELALTGFSPTVFVTAHVTADTATGSLLLSGFAPTVTASDHQTASPGLGELQLDGFAPTVSAGTGAIPETGALLLSGFSPTVSVTAHVVAETATGSLVLTGLSPSVTVSDHQTVTPATGELLLTGFAPSIFAGTTAATETGVLQLTGFEPTVTVTANVEAATGVGSLLLTGFAPTVTASDHQIAATATGLLVLTGFAPEIYAGTTAETATGALQLTGFAPTVSVTAHVTAQTAVGELILSGLAPVVSVSDHQTATPSTGALVLNGFAPTVSVGDQQTVTPGLGQLTLTGFAPTVVASDHQTAQTAVGALILTGFAPTITVGAVVAIQYRVTDYSGSRYQITDQSSSKHHVEDRSRARFLVEV